MTRKRRKELEEELSKAIKKGDCEMVVAIGNVLNNDSAAKAEYLKAGVEAGVGIVGVGAESALKVWGTNKTMKFEADGHIVTSTSGKNWFSKLFR